MYAFMQPTQQSRYGTVLPVKFPPAPLQLIHSLRPLETSDLICMIIVLPF